MAKKRTKRKTRGEVLTKPKQPRTTSVKSWTDYSRKLEKWIKQKREIQSIKKRAQRKIESLSNRKNTKSNSNSVFGW
jgi:hypothetical protein